MQSMVDLAAVLAQPEGKTLEFKRDLSSPDRVLRSVVAFANTAGGTLVLGVEDKTRRVVGTGDPLALEERVTSLVSDSIEPMLMPDIEVLPWRRTNVVVVRVPPSPVRPHFLRRLGPQKGMFIRVGSTNRQADAAMAEELRRHARNEAFDERTMPELDSEAIDFRAAAESFAERRRLTRGDLETLRVLERYHGRLVPTTGGVLLFGKERNRYFPDAWIQAGLFGGADRTRILDVMEIRSHLPQAVEEAVVFIQRSTAREVVIQGVRRTERWTYPMIAVREAVVNAVVHTDYSQRGAPIRISVFSNRLEVENPGLLPFGLTVEDIRRGISKLRNRVIGRVFHALGLIEQWGSGIQRMMAACEQAGLDPPQMEEVGTHFLVTLSASRRKPPVLDEMDRRILAVLQRRPGLTTRQIADETGRSPRSTRTRLASLVSRGLAGEVGSGPNDPRRQYFLLGQTGV